MKRVLLAVCASSALLLLRASPVLGQTGTIGLFGDVGGASCNIAVGGPAINVYVVHVATPGATACQFSAPKPACLNGTFFADQPVFPVTVGSSQTGVSIGYGSCLGGPIHVLTIVYFAGGVQNPCCVYPVLADPTAEPPGIYMVDCDDRKWQANGGQAVIEPQGCDCPQPTLVLNGYETVAWTDPVWTVRVHIQNTGPGPANAVSATMHQDIPWLTVPDPDCFYGQLPSGGSSSGGADNYTFDLTAHPGGSFNVWFDVNYQDVCGETHNLRLDPEFDLEKGLAASPDALTVCRLGQNYPNPFNPTTTIPVVLPEETDVRLSVFDTRGKLVQELVRRSLPAGSTEIVWNGRDSRGNPVSSGLYFCRLETPSSVETRKLVLVK